MTQSIGVHATTNNVPTMTQTSVDARQIADQILCYGSPKSISELMIELMSIVSSELASKQTELETYHKDLSAQIDAACGLRLMASKWIDYQTSPSSHP